MIALSPISREKSYMCVRLKRGGDGKAPNQHFSSPPKECFAFVFGKLDSTREHHTAGAKVADLMFTVVIIRRKQKKERRGIVSGRWVMINIKVIIIFLAALSRSRTTTNQKKKLKLFARAIKRQKFFYPLNVSAWERLRLRCGGGWKGSNIKFCLCLPVQIRFSRFVGWWEILKDGSVGCLRNMMTLHKGRNSVMDWAWTVWNRADSMFFFLGEEGQWSGSWA